MAYAPVADLPRPRDGDPLALPLSQTLLFGTKETKPGADEEPSANTEISRDNPKWAAKERKKHKERWTDSEGRISAGFVPLISLFSLRLL